MVKQTYSEKQDEISDAVRLGVSLARDEWERSLTESHLQIIDERIDRKIDRMKLWLLFGALSIVIGNFIPLGIIIYQFGTFTEGTRQQLVSLNEAVPTQYTRQDHDVYAQGIDRRFIELEKRASRLEGKHGLD